MSSTKNVANAVGGRTARACDSCITKRARWYCAADDAFLCQACDSSVHSANPLARRHERVRLKTASYKSGGGGSEPSWHGGFTKKARTPRQGKGVKQRNNPFHLVPEVGLDEVNSNSLEENEEHEQLLYRVPVYDPFVGAELCSTPNSSLNSAAVAVANASDSDSGPKVQEDYELESLQGLLIPSDVELAEFAADVESLLGRGLENECMGMEELGLIDASKQEEWECSVGSEKVKVEEEERQQVGSGEMGRESISFELNFDYDDSLETCEDEVKEINDADDMGKGSGEVIRENEKRKILQLDYDAVIIAWSGQKSPWTTGAKPDLDLEEFWPECMGTCGTEVQHPYGGERSSGFGCHPAVMADGGREARVLRYREKRRTRLFSKKIRYEVRKLNAEKRPRMKGRFVKRASFAAAPTTFPLLNK